MKTVFTHANMIDGINKTVHRDAYVVVEGNKITEIGTGAYTGADQDTVEYDLQGYTLMPGMIDTHVHLAMGNEWTDAESTLRFATSMVPVAMKVALNARRALDNGITTLRDAGDRCNVVAELKKLIASGFCVGPRIQCSCDPLRVTNGHFVGEPADGAVEIMKGARHRFEMGADYLKLMVTGGIDKPGENRDKVQFFPEELEAAMRVARNEGARVAAHAHSKSGMRQALEAGVDSIEHGTSIDEELADLFIEKGAWLVPTFSCYTKMARSQRVPAFKRESSQSVLDAKGECFRTAVKKGVKIAMGTDSGSTETPVGDLTVEAAQMVKYGMEPMDVIISTTSSAAELMRLDDKIGSIEVGKLADLLILKSDPLEDITNIGDVAMVLLDGNIVVNHCIVSK